MDFTLNNGLSMIGGDDFTSINTSIDTINATAVFKSGTQTITGNKTFTGDLVVNNPYTDIKSTATISLAGDDVKLNSYAGVSKYGHDAIATVINNDTVFVVNSGSTAGFTVNSTDTLVGANTTGKIEESVAGVVKKTMNSSTTTNTNTTITDVATTRQFQATAGTNVLSITSSSISASQNITVSKNGATDTQANLTLSNGAFNSGIPDVLIRKYTSGIITGTTARYQRTNILKGQITGGVETTTDVLTWATGTGDVTLTANSGSSNIATVQGTTVKLICGVDEKENVTSTTTTLDNTTVNISNGGTTRYTQAAGTTTLTNTSINASGSLYATRYFLGSSGGSNTRLASMTLPLGTCAIPTGSTSPSTITGNWSYTGTSSQIRTPSWGNFYPVYAMIGFDNGTITGGGTMTIAIRVRDETNNYDYSTDAFTLTSTTNNAPTGAAGDFTTFTAGSNERIGGGVLIRFQIVLTRTANITASTKSCYATVYGYQST